MADLEAWAGYFGWVHAPWKASKTAETSTSWAEVHGDDAWHPETPSRYIVEWFTQCGRVNRGFNGLEPLTWLEIDAFARLQQLEMQDWESLAIRNMSVSYCNWYSRTSQDRNIDPPLIPDDETLKRLQAANGRHMKKLMKAS